MYMCMCCVMCCMGYVDSNVHMSCHTQLSSHIALNQPCNLPLKKIYMPQSSIQMYLSKY